MPVTLSEELLQVIADHKSDVRSGNAPRYHCPARLMPSGPRLKQTAKWRGSIETWQPDAGVWWKWRAKA